MKAYDFTCKEAGAACRGHVKADTEEEFIEKLAAHLRKKHHAEPNGTLVDYAKSVVAAKNQGAP